MPEPVVGQQVGGGELDFGSMNVQGLSAMDGLEMLTQLGPMIQKAMAEGNVTIEQGEPDDRHARHRPARGDPGDHEPARHRPRDARAPSENVDAGAYGDMQQQILDALAKHGIDPGASGTSVDFQVKPDDDALVAELDPLDHLRLDRAVAGAGGRALDRVDRVHAVGDLAEDGVLAVEPGRLGGGDDEELRAVRVRARRWPSRARRGRPCSR